MVGKLALLNDGYTNIITCNMYTQHAWTRSKHISYQLVSGEVEVTQC